MTGLLFTPNRSAVPSSSEEVRTTITVVDNDAAPAVAERAPGYNDVDTDHDTAGGLTPRQLGAFVVPSVRYVPHVGNANSTELFDRVNDQVSTSGTAAAREAAGVWGHGTLKITESIEPAVHDGAQLGADYFAASTRPLAGSGDQMSPAQSADPDTVAQSAATGASASRAAYGAYLASTTGITK